MRVAIEEGDITKRGRACERMQVHGMNLLIWSVRFKCTICKKESCDFGCKLPWWVLWLSCALSPHLSRPKVTSHMRTGCTCVAVSVGLADQQTCTCAVCRYFMAGLRCGRQPFHRGMTCEDFSRAYQRRKQQASSQWNDVRSTPKSWKIQHGLQRRSVRPLDLDRAFWGQSWVCEAEQLFEQWMEKTGSKQCPTCRMAAFLAPLSPQGADSASARDLSFEFRSSADATKVCWLLLTWSKQLRLP